MMIHWQQYVAAVKWSCPLHELHIDACRALMDSESLKLLFRVDRAEWLLGLVA